MFGLRTARKKRKIHKQRVLEFKREIAEERKNGATRTSQRFDCNESDESDNVTRKPITRKPDNGISDYQTICSRKALKERDTSMNYTSIRRRINGDEPIIYGI